MVYIYFLDYAFEDNVLQAVETVENMSEIVEEVAEKVDKITEEIEEKLPGDSKLKESLDSIENLAEGAVKYANEAQDIIQKVSLIFFFFLFKFSCILFYVKKFDRYTG